MRTGVFLRALFEKVDKGIAAVEIDPAAGLRGSSQVVVGIEPGIGLAALSGSVQQVMREGMHVRGGEVGITFQIKCRVE